MSYSNENYYAGARASGLSNAYISFSGIWAAFHNQSGLAGLTDFSAGCYYESKFGIDKLSLVAGSVCLPVNAGVLGLSIYQFGKGTFKENKFGLAFARQLSEKWHAGLQLDYFTKTFPENKSPLEFVTVEGGIIYHPLEKLFLGVHIFNPLSDGFESPSGKIRSPVIFRTGGHYRFDEKILITFETQNNDLNPILLRSGIEFSPVEKLALRLGASSNPFKYTAGIGYIIDNLTGDICFSYHGNLGITPSVSIQFQL